MFSAAQERSPATDQAIVSSHPPHQPEHQADGRRSRPVEARQRERAEARRPRMPRSRKGVRRQAELQKRTSLPRPRRRKQRRRPERRPRRRRPTAPPVAGRPRGLPPPPSAGKLATPPAVSAPSALQFVYPALTRATPPAGRLGTIVLPNRPGCPPRRDRRPHRRSHPRRTRGHRRRSRCDARHGRTGRGRDEAELRRTGRGRLVRQRPGRLPLPASLLPRRDQEPPAGREGATPRPRKRSSVRSQTPPTGRR